MFLYERVIQSILTNILDNLNSISKLFYLTDLHKNNLDIIVGDVLMMLNREKAIDHMDIILNECRDIGGTFWENLLRILSHKKYAVYMKQNFWAKYILNVKEDSIQDNFNKYTENLFSNFEWSGCVAGGGSVIKSCDNDFETKLSSGAYNGSDVDIFLYGTTKTKKKKLTYILNFLEEKFGEFAYRKNDNVLTIYSSAYHMPIQIIACNSKNMTQVIMNFTMSHQQIIYDGKKVYNTKNYLDTQMTNVSFCYDSYIRGELVAKTVSLGYYIMSTGNTILDDYITWAIANFSPPKPLFTKTTFFEKLRIYLENRFAFDPYLRQNKLEGIEKEDIVDSMKYGTHFDALNY